MDKDIPTEQPIGIPLCISACAYILLWFTAMRFISAIDAIVLFSIVVFTNYGIYRGGIRTLLGFAGSIIAFLVAIYGYDKLYLGLEVRLNEITPLWGQFICFLILLLGSWILWYLVSRIFLHWQKIGLKNPVAGGIIGFTEGILILYLFLTIVLSSKFLESHPSLENELEKSFIVQNSKIILSSEHFNKIDLIVRFQKFHLHKKIQWIAYNLANNDEKLEERIRDFLIWLSQNPSSVDKWVSHPEIQNCFEKFLLIPEGKKYWLEEEFLQKLKQKKQFNIAELCSLLQRAETLKLVKNAHINQILQIINFEKIKSGI